MLLAGLLPGSLLTWGLLRFLFSGRERNARWRTPELGYFVLAGSWCVLFFSLSSCKLPTYVLPAFPPLALKSGGVIPNTQMRGTIRGQAFHGWSRNRGGVAWNPAKDNVVTQLALADEAMAKEAGQ